MAAACRSAKFIVPFVDFQTGRNASIIRTSPTCTVGYYKVTFYAMINEEILHVVGQVEEKNENEDKFQDTLHDSFFETYWEWKKIRGDKNWKLDTSDE